MLGINCNADDCRAQAHLQDVQLNVQLFSDWDYPEVVEINGLLVADAASAASKALFYNPRSDPDPMSC
jgi:hypothetical protein